jgi:uncharacterized protein YndB with AHSA1/START domain
VPPRSLRGIAAVASASKKVDRKGRGCMAREPGQEQEGGTCVSLIIKAPRRTIYQVLVDPEAIVAWLPPQDMQGHLHEFDAREGGTYRMSLTYRAALHAVPGKTSEHTDTVQARFLALVPDERIVQSVEFESNDPAFIGPMTIIWTLAEVPGGTHVTVRCENEPPGIRPGDHAAGIRSSLKNLAAFVE